jgi:hypothetical protein
MFQKSLPRELRPNPVVLPGLFEKLRAIVSVAIVDKLVASPDIYLVVVWT